MKEMSPDTLEALEGSIAKWEAIVAGTGVDLGTDNCPLCVKFLIPFQFGGGHGKICQDCPVAQTAKAIGCSNTPYEYWKRVTHDQGFVRAVVNPITRSAAQAELDFLKSLLPKESM